MKSVYLHIRLAISHTELCSPVVERDSVMDNAATPQYLRHNTVGYILTHQGLTICTGLVPPLHNYQHINNNTKIDPGTHYLGEVVSPWQEENLGEVLLPV